MVESLGQTQLTVNLRPVFLIISRQLIPYWDTAKARFLSHYPVTLLAKRLLAVEEIYEIPFIFA